MLTARSKSGAYSQVSSTTVPTGGRVRTINVRIAERNRRIDVVQQLGLDAIGVDQTLPETFQTPARYLAHGGGDDLFAVTTSGAFFVRVVRVWLKHVNLQVRLGDRDRPVGARRFGDVDSFYRGFEFRGRFPSIEDG